MGRRVNGWSGGEAVVGTDTVGKVSTIREGCGYSEERAGLLAGETSKDIIMTETPN